MKELFPILKKIGEFTVGVTDMNRNLFSGFVRKDINKKLSQYKILMREYVTLFHKWNTPDILFADIDKKISDNPREMGIILQDYNNMDVTIQRNFDRGFKLLEQSDKMLTNQNTSSYTRISILISTAAVVISSFAIWATFAARNVD